MRVRAAHAAGSGGGDVIVTSVGYIAGITFVLDGRLPFDRVIDEAKIRRQGMNPDWFTPHSLSRLFGFIVT